MEKREKSSRLVIFIFFIPFLLWILLQFLAPIALPANSIQDLSGYTGLKDNEDAIEDMPLPWNLIYSSGDRLCHEKSSRSFFINGNQMPFCSRCTAIWLGMAIGLGFMVFYKIQVDEKFILLILIGLAPIGIDGVGQQIGLWESNNLLRVITGILIGIVCGLAIGIIVDEISEMYLLRKKQKLNN